MINSQPCALKKLEKRHSNCGKRSPTNPLQAEGARDPKISRNDFVPLLAHIFSLKRGWKSIV